MFTVGSIQQTQRILVKQIDVGNKLTKGFILIYSSLHKKKMNCIHNNYNEVFNTLLRCHCVKIDRFIIIKQLNDHDESVISPEQLILTSQIANVSDLKKFNILFLIKHLTISFLLKTYYSTLGIGWKPYWTKIWKS